MSPQINIVRTALVAVMTTAAAVSAMRIEPSCGGETGVSPHDTQSGMSVCKVFADDRGSFATFAPMCSDRNHQCLRFAIPPNSSACELEWAPASLATRRQLASSRQGVKESSLVCNTCQRLGHDDSGYFVIHCDAASSGNTAQRVMVKTGCDSECSACGGPTYAVLSAAGAPAATCTPLWPRTIAGTAFKPPVGALLAADLVACDVTRFRSLTNRSNTTSDESAFLKCEPKANLKEIGQSADLSRRVFGADIYFGNGACAPLIASNASGAAAAWVKTSCAEPEPGTPDSHTPMLRLPGVVVGIVMGAVAVVVAAAAALFYYARRRANLGTYQNVSDAGHAGPALYTDA